MPRFQYSLRTALILTAIVAAAFGWWTYKAEKQRRAVAALCRGGTTVWYKDGDRVLDDPFPPLVDFRYQVQGVTLYKPPSDSDLDALQTLDKLETVFVIFGGTDDLIRIRAALPQCRIQSVKFESQ